MLRVLVALVLILTSAQPVWLVRRKEASLQASARGVQLPDTQVQLAVLLPVCCMVKPLLRLTCN
jgi:uncharacterized iron-regulated membrane protein